MGVAYVNSWSASDLTGTATHLDITVSPSKGNCLVVAVATNASPTISSVVDNLGTSYIFKASSNPSFGHAFLYALNNIPSGVTTITVNFTPAMKIFVAVGEYSGVTNVGLGQMVLAGTASSVTAGSVTLTTQANNNVLVGIFWIGSAGTGPAGTSGTSIRQNIVGGGGFGDAAVFADNTIASAGSLSTAITWSGAGGYGACGLELSTSTPFTFVQGIQNLAYIDGTSVAKTFDFGQLAGNFNIACVFWKGAVTVTSVTDDAGNSYVDCGAGQVARPTDGFVQVFIAQNIATRSVNNVTAHFSATTTGASPTIFILEYAGGATTGTLADKNSTGTATSGTSVTSGSVTTSVANELAFAFCYTSDTNGSAGAGYAARIANAGDGSLCEDQLIASAGSSVTGVGNMSATITKGVIVLVTLEPVPTGPLTQDQITITSSRQFLA